MKEDFEKRTILIISSLSPDKSAHLGMDVRSSLEKVGYEVDFLTHWASSSQKVISIEKHTEVQQPLAPVDSPRKKASFFKQMFRFLQKKEKENKFVIIHRDESTPPVDPVLITAQITKKYDFAIILFWQGMLTAATLGEIYNKMKAPIFVLAVDMFPFTGGCFYFWNCRKFIHSSCAKCPGLKSTKENSAMSLNFIYKQEIYRKIKCVFLVNSWMKHYIEQTPIRGENPIRSCLLVVNESTFKLRDKKSVRLELNLDQRDKMFFIFAGAPSLNEKRKGFTYLARAMNMFTRTLSHAERSQVVLLIAGNSMEQMQSYFNVKVCQLGFLPYEKLAKAYNAANVYLSPSIEDAGPSMINQSIMSGTPVVAFNIGVAQDLVITGETGYLARTLDAKDFANGIRYIYSLSSNDYLNVQKKCRKLALSLFSYDAFADKIKQYDNEFCQ